MHGDPVARSLSFHEQVLYFMSNFLFKKAFFYSFIPHKYRKLVQVETALGTGNMHFIVISRLWRQTDQMKKTELNRIELNWQHAFYCYFHTVQTNKLMLIDQSAQVQYQTVLIHYQAVLVTKAGLIW